MASLQKIALYIFFDSVELDLTASIRKHLQAGQEDFLTTRERHKASDNLARRNGEMGFTSDLDLIPGLDLGEKYDVLLRLKVNMDEAARKHYLSIKKHFDNCIKVRNSVMHGRPLTIDEYAAGFALTNELMRSQIFWPKLSAAFRRYTEDPASLAETAVQYLDEFGQPETFNNLPFPDYEDTGFFPRKRLEAELKKKILGRHPVITVLGDGGDGKTAVTIQTLYGLLASNEHDFDAIIWVSAKSSKLIGKEIERIENAITSSMEIFGEVARLFEVDVDDPMERVLSLMESNKILLVIDNLETVIDKTVQRFAEDIPGQSKLLLTSRIPLGSDLSIQVDPFSDNEALSFLRVLISTYNVKALSSETDMKLKHYAKRLHNKPLLLKWFALGVLSGLNPSSIVGNPENALKFCMENVFDALSSTAKNHLSAISVLPGPCSIPILAHVTEDEPGTIEASIAELSRHSIIERASENQYESCYQIKPLAKSYLVRVLKTRAKDSEDILRRFRQIEGIYQNERGAKQHNRYNPNHFVVRSKSEAIAVSKLKSAVRLSRSDEFLSSFMIIDSLKISNPDYFEVSRTEAYLASLSGDHARAQNSYLTALEIDQQQPQVHMMYGNFLLRTFGDHEGALEQFKSAIILDLNSSTAYIGAARASLYLFDFSEAENYLIKAQDCVSDDARAFIIISDLKLQSLWRHFEYLKRDRNENEAASVLLKVKDFLEDLRLSSIDSNFIAQLKKIDASLLEAKRDNNMTLNDAVDQTRLQIQIVFEMIGVNLNGYKHSEELGQATSVPRFDS
jgi:LuxR family transcriptional regulator, glucitol operon activator